MGKFPLLLVAQVTLGAGCTTGESTKTTSDPPTDGLMVLNLMIPALPRARVRVQITCR